ncbi:MAG TPA: DNA methylase [Pusillimonas sp.]|nr:DNA methylase [Pusillimonas sp.]
MSRYYQGDCLHILPTFPDRCIDFVLTDPPYLVNYHDRTGRSIANDMQADWLEPEFKQAYRVLRPDSFCVSFYGWNRVDYFFRAWKEAGFRVVGHLVFAKTYQSSAKYVQYRHESAYLLAKGKPALPVNPLPDLLPWKYTGNKLHPTQKPVESLARLVEAFSKPEAIVLDPFAGSGSTCVAAKQTGRRYIGIELDAQYHAAGMKRLAGCARSISN